MNRTIRIVKLLFLAIALLLCLATLVMSLYMTTQYWEGFCYGPSDLVKACPWWEFAWSQLFWGLMIFIPFMFVLSLVWILIALIQFIVEQWKKFKK
jgi:hypothetical protein